MSTLFWERLTAICDERKETPTGVCRKIGLSSGNPPAWREGRVPSMAIIQKLSRHFHVPERYFLEEDYEKEKAPAETAGATEDDIRFALFGDAPISDEDMEAVRTFAQMLAEKARKKKESDD